MINAGLNVAGWLFLGVFLTAETHGQGLYVMPTTETKISASYDRIAASRDGRTLAVGDNTPIAGPLASQTRRIKNC